MPTKPPGTPDLDLTEAGSFGVIGDAVFTTGQIQPAGTGQFDAFVQIQNNGTEQGYNTDASAQYDEKNSHNHNHSILLADVPIVFGDGTNGTVEGVAYREFLLDLNEPNGNTKPYISLDKLQIWQQEAGNLTNFTPGAGFAGAHTNYKAYDLDAGGDKWIALTSNMSHGSGQSDYRILIPDSFFINDAAHRYVTLYSQFGTQPGWSSDGGFEEWGLHGTSGGSRSAFSVNKTASVPGGTADTAGEVITYSIAVSNTGNTALTGVTVSDPDVSNLAAVLNAGFNVGDTNQDNQLSAGETWLYSASHTVTQSDIDTNGGGDGVIANTVTADTNETSPVSASALVLVAQQSAVVLTKTADVASVNAVGDVINYTINVQNTGNVTLTDITVEDSQVNIVTPVIDLFAQVLGPLFIIGPVISGDYNAGDTNENGIEDPGETFQFAILGDENLNGIEDPGETFVHANAGDTNQNGVVDPGETFVFANVGDTNQNGVEDPGETFQFDVSHAATPVDANHDNFNDGDVNHDGAINLGETWQYTVSYTVTQDDIDNGGVVDPALTHDNTASVATAESAFDTGSVSVSIVQDPRITLVKTASVQDGTADEAGDVISYSIAVTNTGNMTLTGVAVVDPSVSNLTFVGGDTDGDNKLDLTETWTYSANHTVTQAEIDNGGVVNPALAFNNTASVTTAQGTALPSPDPDANDSDSASVPIVQDPRVNLVKAASVADGSANAAGDVINYTITVTNTGNMTLTGVTVVDPSVSNLTFAGGDTDGDNKLDLTETWTYSASHTVTQADIDNGGVVNPALAYSNTASVTTAQGTALPSPDPDANDSDSESVPIVQSPSIALDKTASVPGGTADTAGEVISYTINVSNTGNMTLTGVTVVDPSVSNLMFAGGDMDGDNKLDLGETWQYSASHTVTQSDLDTNGGGDGVIQNTASVSTTQGATANDSASVTVVPPLTVGISIDDNFNLSQLVDPGGDGPSVGDLIQFFFQITNLGNTTLTNVAVSDTLGDAIPGSLQTPIPSSLAGNAIFTDTFNHTITAADIAAGEVVDDITVTALDYLSVLQTATWHYDFDL